MNKIATCAIAIAALIDAPAFAADMAVKAPPRVSTPTYSWTGWYVGGNAGGAWSQARVSATLTPDLTPPNVAAVTAADTTSLDGSGFTGGVQAGFNYRAGALVWGIEADFDAFRTSQSNTGNFIAPLGAIPFATTNSFSTNWLATLRPRVGVVTLDQGRGLIYATGGLAVTRLGYNTLFTAASGDVESAAISSTRAGWTIGGGIEYALPGNWSVKVEYLWLDFSDFNTSGIDTVSIPPEHFAHSVRLISNLVRFGLNYYLGSH